jgi:hypothetical protein
LKTETILYFIRKYYVLDCHSKGTNIVIRDIGDNEMKGQIIPISLIKSKEITFLWGRGRSMTGIDLYHKKWAQELPGQIMRAFRHERTQDFFSLLLNEKIPCIIPLSDIPLEFPNLFSNGLQEAFKIRTTKT